MDTHLELLRFDIQVNVILLDIDRESNLTAVFRDSQEDGGNAVEASPKI